MSVGYRCRVCGTEVDAGEPAPWRCPKATADDRRHVLAFVPPPDASTAAGGAGTAPIAAPIASEQNPFVAYGPRLAWHRFATERGLDADACDQLVRDADAAIEAVAATGFRVTPFERSVGLSDALDLQVWVKDETHNVAGSHKARHLFTILLQLQAAERLGLAGWSASDRPSLAISSCGNAAIAAATLAAAVDWPIDVFVPTWAPVPVLRRLHALRAGVTVCERRGGDPPGDPCVMRFREAVQRGAVPFSVQGPENALCLDGGRTLGWELADQAAAAGVRLDRIFVQVGGGALAGSLGAALLDTSPATKLHAVQTEGCAPLERAWLLAGDDARDAAARWPELMWPWDDPRSAADGILDDETYDWLAVFEAMQRNGGWPVVAREVDVLAAHDLVHTRTAIDGSVTGTAGLAGLLAMRDQLRSGEQVAIVLSGITR
jgi:threonine synthase